MTSIRTGWAAPTQYDQRNEQTFRDEMERRDLQTFKRGVHLDLGASDFYIVLRSPNGTPHSITVSDAGALVVTPL